MQFTPYLNFDGNCAEAFAFYAKLFGGVIAYQSTFGEIPASADMHPMPESAKNSIMHVQLQIKEQSLMGYDSMQAAEATCGGYQPPQGLSVSGHAADVAAGRHLFAPLAQARQTMTAVRTTLWSS